MGTRPPTPSRSTPGRSVQGDKRPVSTPGDMAPLALVPGDRARSASPGAIWRTATPTGVPDTLKRSNEEQVLGRWPQTPPFPAGANASFGLWQMKDGQGSARAWGDVGSAAPRRDDMEQRLAELCGLLEGLAEEQSGQAKRLEHLGDTYHSTRARLDAVEQAQRSMAMELSMIADVAESLGSQSGAHPHRKEKVCKVREC